VILDTAAVSIDRREDWDSSHECRGHCGFEPVECIVVNIVQ